MLKRAPSQIDSPDMSTRDARAREQRGHELRGPVIVRHLRRRGSIRTSALADELGLPYQTLANTVDLLEKAEIIRHDDGRMQLYPELGILVGVDVSRATAKVAISTLDFQLLNANDAGAEQEISIHDPEATLKEIAALVAGQLKSHVGRDRVRQRLVGVGITLPGPVLREPNPSPSKQASSWNRRVHAGPILPGWDDVDVGARLANLLKATHFLHPPRHNKRRFVWVENDASAGALGVHTELRLTRPDDAPDDLIYIRMASGIGAGIVNKGHLLGGARGVAGEVGHVCVEPGGALCAACGGRGCLETLASSKAVLRQLGEVLHAPPEEPSDEARLIKDPIAPRDADNELARLLADPASSHPAVDRALRDAGWHVGTLLANVCCVLNPSWIVFGGPMAEYRSASSGTGPPPGLRVPAIRDDASAPAPPADGRPFVRGVRDALRIGTTPQARAGLRVRTWDQIRSSEDELSPELLGALALVVDHLGDAYLRDPIEEWIRTPGSRKDIVSFD
jgi:predicted NBD/HSP70 family sugar kinase